MQGALHPGSLPKLLGELFAGARSGVLRMTRDSQGLALCLRDGRIASLEVTPRPGRPMRGSALARSLEKRLGTLLHDLGISPHQQALASRAALMDALSWREGAYTFEEQGTAALDAETAVRDLSIPELIREAVRRIGDPEVVRDALGDVESELAPGPVDRRSLELTPSETAVLSWVDGAGTIRETIESATLPQEEARNSLLCLLCMGALERLPRAAGSARVESEAEAPPVVEAAAVADDRVAHATQPPPAPDLARVESKTETPPAVEAPAPVDDRVAVAEQLPRPPDPIRVDSEAEARPAVGPPAVVDDTAAPVEHLPRTAEPTRVTSAPARPSAVEAAAFIDDGATAVRRREIQDAVLNLLHADHFEILGITRHASHREVREAYLRQAKRFHPDRHADPTFAGLKQQLEALLIRMGEAYEVLRNPARRARYEAELAAQFVPARTASSAPAAPAPLDEAADAIENAIIADDAIRRAEQHMQEAQYWDAIQILEGVIPRIQSMRLKHAAQVRLARAYTKNPHWVRRGEDLLQSVVREDPSRADAYFVLGTIYRGNGLRNRAITMFRKVLDLVPNHGPASAQIRSLEHLDTARKLPGRP